MRLNLPPFGYVLLEWQKQGVRPQDSVYVMSGYSAIARATDWQRRRQGTLCAPPYEDPGNFFWPVKSCDVLVFDRGFSDPEYLNDLAYYLYKYQASKVRCVTSDFDLIVFDK